jgi:uncharacterized membrane protein
MNWVNYLFFNIYNWFYKDGMYNRKIDPNIQTISIFVMGTMGWLGVFSAFYSHFIAHSDFLINNSYKLYIIGVVLFLMIFYNYYFFVNDKYLNIYHQYKIYSKENKNRKRDLVLSFIIIFFPFPLIVIYAVLMHLGIIR